MATFNKSCNCDCFDNASRNDAIILMSKKLAENLIKPKDNNELNACQIYYNNYIIKLFFRVIAIIDSKCICCLSNDKLQNLIDNNNIYVDILSDDTNIIIPPIPCQNDFAIYSGNTYSSTTDNANKTIRIVLTFNSDVVIKQNCPCYNINLVITDTNQLLPLNINIAINSNVIKSDDALFKDSYTKVYNFKNIKSDNLYQFFIFYDIPMSSKTPNLNFDLYINPDICPIT
jgi:hypothetical protein